MYIYIKGEQIGSIIYVCHMARFIL